VKIGSEPNISHHKDYAEIATFVGTLLTPAKVIRFSQFRPEPVIQSEPPVDEDALGTLRQVLN
jgi:hypothetical protein